MHPHDVSVFSYKSACVAIFERDKILFALQLCFSIMREQSTLNMNKFDFICFGGAERDDVIAVAVTKIEFTTKRIGGVQRLPEFLETSFEAVLSSS